MKFEEIKLIIWDLDDTLWKGTLSEEKVVINQNAEEIVRMSTDSGVVNSVCSKNDFNNAFFKLKEFNLDYFFVCPIINWESKGFQIKNLIEKLGFRDVNVLFIDDNDTNLNEVKFLCPNIMTLNSNNINDLHSYFKNTEKKDLSHNRLKKYKILEKKIADSEKIGNNYEFLKQSHILISIHEVNDVDRIVEMINRTNQLNFTKIRIKKEELLEYLNNDAYECKCIEVKDKYGDYGVIGFYCLDKKNNTLIHFLFSCRTLGLKIEKYVYELLNKPIIKIAPPVVSDLGENIDVTWVKLLSETDYNIIVPNEMNSASDEKIKILFKGPCDMSLVFNYLNCKLNCDTEFTYINEDNHVSIESYNHTIHLVESLSLSNEIKTDLINSLPFSSKEFFSDKMFKEKYNFIFYSLLTDGNLGVYEHKQSNAKFAFGEYTYDLTNEQNWQLYINEEIFTAGCKFNIENLEKIKTNFNFLGRIKPDEIVENIKFVLDNISDKTVLVLFLGSSYAYEKNKHVAYVDRHIFHQEINEKIKQLAMIKKNLKIIDFTDFIVNQECFYDNINHFSPNVYYEVAKKITSMINDETNGKNIKTKSFAYLIFNKIKACIKKVLKK